MQNYLKRLDQWHSAIKPSDTDCEKLYADLVGEEITEALTAVTMPAHVKELCDVIVVARGAEIYGKLSFTIKYAGTIIDGATDALEALSVNVDKAMHAVNESNFSKLVLPSEIDDAMSFYEQLDVQVRIEPVLDGAYYGIYSACDQTVNGKTYRKDKLLKSHRYAPVDESVHWWL
jgi:hypothetical protein